MDERSPDEPPDQVWGELGLLYSPGDTIWPGSDEWNRAKVKAWKKKHRAAVTRYKREARGRDYLTKPFVAIDSEGEDVLGNTIHWNRGGHDIPYEDHNIFMWGAATIDGTRAPEWLIYPETMAGASPATGSADARSEKGASRPGPSASKRELDPLDVLEWLVSLPEKYGDANYIMYSFSYDVIHILKHLRFEKAWEVFKGEKYDKDKTKRRKTRLNPTFCGRRFDRFAMTFKNRKQLDIWKLRDPAKPYLRNENGDYVLDKKKGTKILDAVAHITIFDAYSFFQQSFASATRVLVKLGKAKEQDFKFLEEMKAKRGRFATEPIETIKSYTEFELRYLAEIMTELRNILHGIKHANEINGLRGAVQKSGAKRSALRRFGRSGMGYQALGFDQPRVPTTVCGTGYGQDSSGARLCGAMHWQNGWSRAVRYRV